MDMKAIRDKDEEYWDEFKGTPTGFISLAAGQKLWANRFGNLTAIRMPDEGQTAEAKSNMLALRLNLSDIGLIPRDFKTEAGAAVFLISLKAGGYGLNLTAADMVIHLDPWWNPAIEAQAIDRAHRIGQKNTVFTYKFITRNTIEEKILSLHP
jgi:hypothetical protein